MCSAKSDMEELRAGVDQLPFAINLGDLFEQYKGIPDLTLAVCLWTHLPVKGAPDLNFLGHLQYGVDLNGKEAGSGDDVPINLETTINDLCWLACMFVVTFLRIREYEDLSLLSWFAVFFFPFFLSVSTLFCFVTRLVLV